MKKILTILSATSLIITPTIGVISCQNKSTTEFDYDSIDYKNPGKYTKQQLDDYFLDLAKAVDESSEQKSRYDFLNKGYVAFQTSFFDDEVEALDQSSRNELITNAAKFLVYTTSLNIVAFEQNLKYDEAGTSEPIINASDRLIWIQEMATFFNAAVSNFNSFRTNLNVNLSSKIINQLNDLALFL